MRWTGEGKPSEKGLSIQQGIPTNVRNCWEVRQASFERCVIASFWIAASMGFTATFADGKTFRGSEIDLKLLDHHSQQPNEPDAMLAFDDYFQGVHSTTSRACAKG